MVFQTPQYAKIKLDNVFTWKVCDAGKCECRIHRNSVYISMQFEMARVHSHCMHRRFQNWNFKRKHVETKWEPRVPKCNVYALFYTYIYLHVDLKQWQINVSFNITLAHLSTLCVPCELCRTLWMLVRAIFIHPFHL